MTKKEAAEQERQESIAWLHAHLQSGRDGIPNGTDKPHGRRNGEPDSSGGYALKSRWM